MVVASMIQKHSWRWPKQCALTNRHQSFSLFKICYSNWAGKPPTAANIQINPWNKPSMAYVDEAASNIHPPNLSVWFRQYQWFIPLRKWYAWYCGRHNQAVLKPGNLRMNLTTTKPMMWLWFVRDSGALWSSCQASCIKTLMEDFLKILGGGPTSVDTELIGRIWGLPLIIDHSWSWFQHRAMFCAIDTMTFYPSCRPPHFMGPQSKLLRRCDR